MKKIVFSIMLISMQIVFLCSCNTKNDSVENELVEKYEAKLPTENVEAGIFVSKIEGISDDFIKGVDISSLLSEEASGVKYYDENQNEEDIFKVLADAGVNYIRVRVWNDPFDENGNGYGGGNCTVETASILAKRAAAYNMKTCVDFHYSDFWADPSKQMCPKEWTGLGIDEKADAIKNYTKDSLEMIIEAGGDVGMVQIGNETNSGIAGVKSNDNIYKLIAAGCEGARQVSSDILVAVHFTQIDNHDDTLNKAAELKKANADYDVFGVSYYPYWHGTMDNMNKVLKDIKSEYGVDTCIMETSYPYTSEDSDGFSNSVSGKGDILTEYPASVQGQAKALRDVCAFAYDAGALGVFYWEPAWISVGEDSLTNKEKWENYGSGWATSYAASYDPNDAGNYYGGCSWDNQALFDKNGHPLESLNTFKYLQYGSTAAIEVLAIKDVDIVSPVGIELEMPKGVEAVFNDSDLSENVEVEWDEADLASIDINIPGKYTVKGKAQNGWDIIANVKVASVNYIRNSSFEEEDCSMWEISYNSAADPTDIQDKAADAVSGSKSFHFWSPSAIDFTIEQKVEGLHDGSYTATCNIQGSDLGQSEDISFYVTVNGEEVACEKVKLTGWVEWKNPILTDIEVSEDDEVIVGLRVIGDAKGWGTTDDWEFY